MPTLEHQHEYFPESDTDTGKTLLHERLLYHLEYQENILQQTRSSNMVAQSLYLGLALATITIVASKDAWTATIPIGPISGDKSPWQVIVVTCLNMLAISIGLAGYTAYGIRSDQISKRRRIVQFLQTLVFENEIGSLARKLNNYDIKRNRTSGEWPLLSIIKLAEQQGVERINRVANEFNFNNKTKALIQDFMTSKEQKFSVPTITNSPTNSSQKPALEAFKRITDNEVNFGLVWIIVFCCGMFVNIMVTPDLTTLIFIAAFNFLIICVLLSVRS